MPRKITVYTWFGVDSDGPFAYVYGSAEARNKDVRDNASLLWNTYNDGPMPEEAFDICTYVNNPSRGTEWQTDQHDIEVEG